MINVNDSEQHWCRRLTNMIESMTAVQIAYILCIRLQ